MSRRRRRWARAGFIAIVLLLVGHPTTRGFAAVPMNAMTVDRVRECLAQAKRCRITGTFGCFECTHPEVSSEGIASASSEPCDFIDRGPARQVFWDEIEKVEIPRSHRSAGTVIGVLLGIGGATAYVLSRSSHSGFDLLLIPLAIGIVAFPLELAGGLAGGAIGGGEESWTPCYVNAAAPSPPR